MDALARGPDGPGRAGRSYGRRLPNTLRVRLRPTQAPTGCLLILGHQLLKKGRRLRMRLSCAQPATSRAGVLAERHINRPIAAAILRLKVRATLGKELRVLRPPPERCSVERRLLIL